MGHHYLPQEYLRGFADPNEPGMIWMYDKQRQQFTHAPIKSVAQEAGYYAEDVERQLNDLVERPANIILKKLRSGGQISVTERTTLALYIGTMLRRVPRRRRKAYELVPNVHESAKNQTIAQVLQWAQTTTADPQFVSRRIAEVEQAFRDFALELPNGIVDYIRSPWPSSKDLECISLMTWRILSSTGSGFFLTSDDPAYFFEEYGLGRRESELTLPLASDLALHASWQGPPGETFFFEAKPALVREITRRSASSAERFLFCQAKKDWVGVIAEKQRLHLSRVQWT